jgi:hypothetical protein
VVNNTYYSSPEDRVQIGRRGTRLARREEKEYWTYCDDEQRSQPG